MGVCHALTLPSGEVAAFSTDPARKFCGARISAFLESVFLNFNIYAMVPREEGILWLHHARQVQHFSYVLQAVFSCNRHVLLSDLAKNHFKILLTKCTGRGLGRGIYV
jgi:hypothetical protein